MAEHQNLLIRNAIDYDPEMEAPHKRLIYQLLDDRWQRWTAEPEHGNHPDFTNSRSWPNYFEEVNINVSLFLVSDDSQDQQTKKKKTPPHWLSPGWREFILKTWVEPIRS